MYALKKFYEWLKLMGVDIHVRILKLEFLYEHEVSSLVDYFGLSRGKRNPGGVVSGAKKNFYIGVVSSYLQWYANSIVTDSYSDEYERRFKRFESCMLLRKVKLRSRHQEDIARLDKRLSDKARNKLLEVFEGIDSVGFRCGVQYRNWLMLHVLYETGMRVGELLSLTLSDYEHALGGNAPRLTIKRNHDDPYDRRVRQPVAKTLGRIISISDGLAKKIEVYLRDYRLGVPGADFGEEAGLFIRHKAGAGQGKVMSVSAYYASLSNVRKKYPEIGELHPHLLRHDWNYRFSNYAQEKGFPEAKENSIREYLMGWAPGSGTAKIYNLRFIQEQSFLVGVDMANWVVDRRDL